MFMVEHGKVGLAFGMGQGGYAQRRCVVESSSYRQHYPRMRIG